jgi:hypothetical protein
MKDLTAMAYIRKKHGNRFDKNKSDVSHSIDGFMHGWKAAVESVMTIPPIKSNYVSILNHVSDITGVSIIDMCLDTRKGKIVDARAVFASSCKILMPMCMVTMIGKYVSQPHDVVLHYLGETSEKADVAKTIERSVVSYYKKHM